jgi:hypothetical protein
METYFAMEKMPYITAASITAQNFSPLHQTEFFTKQKNKFKGTCPE